jgi:hypothetical protein
LTFKSGPIADIVITGLLVAAYRIFIDNSIITPIGTIITALLGSVFGYFVAVFVFGQFRKWKNRQTLDL